MAALLEIFVRCCVKIKLFVTPLGQQNLFLLAFRRALCKCCKNKAVVPEPITFECFVTHISPCCENKSSSACIKRHKFPRHFVEYAVVLLGVAHVT